MDMNAPSSFVYFDVEGTPVRRQATAGPEVYRGGKWQAYADLARLSQSGQRISFDDCKKLMKGVDKVAARQTAGEKTAAWPQH